MVWPAATVSKYAAPSNEIKDGTKSPIEAKIVANTDNKIWMDDYGHRTFLSSHSDANSTLLHAHLKPHN